jgi:hypothetical protein
MVFQPTPRANGKDLVLPVLCRCGTTPLQLGHHLSLFMQHDSIEIEARDRGNALENIGSLGEDVSMIWLMVLTCSVGSWLRVASVANYSMLTLPM